MINKVAKKILRIGIDARFYGPLGKGLGRYTQEIVDHILSLDDYNEYIIFLGKDNFNELKTVNPRLKKVLAEVRWYTLREQIIMPFLIRKFKIDLMHFPHFNVPFFSPRPFIVTIHDLILTKFPTRRASTLGPVLYFIKNFFYKLIIRRAVNRSKKIITVSEYTKQDIINNFSIDEKKIVVTLEGASDLSKESDKFFVQKLSKEKTLASYCILEPYLLYVGNAYPHKNLEKLIKVFSNIHHFYPQIKLVLVGKNDYFYDRLKLYVSSLKIEGVIFPGYVADRHLDVLFNHALAYVFPSKYEGFGLPPLEAMSRGRPVISSQATCLPEILGEAALYFNPDDEADMENKIIEIINNRPLRQKLINLGHEQVKKYNWRECALETLKIYEQSAR